MPSAGLYHKIVYVSFYLKSSEKFLLNEEMNNISECRYSKISKKDHYTKLILMNPKCGYMEI